MDLSLYLIVFLSSLCLVEGACTFPTNLQNGQFDSNKGGEVNFTSNQMIGFKVHDFGELTFTCDTQDGTKYVSKSNIFFKYQLAFEAFICMDITEISTNKFIFYQPTSRLKEADYVRMKIYLQGKTITSASEICEVSDYSTLSANMLLRTGSISSEKITCPTDLQGKYNYTWNDGSGIQCSAESLLDTCTDDTLFNYNYTKCSQIQAYSSGGQLNCLYQGTFNTYNYLIMYNLDATVDDSTTYRFTCYVYEISGSTVDATQYPSECHAFQNASGVDSPGAEVDFIQFGTCTTTTTVAPETTSSSASLGLIIGIIILLLIIVLIVVFIIWYCWKKKKDEEERKRLELEALEEARRREEEEFGMPDESKYDIDRLMYTPDHLLTPSNVHAHVTGKVIDKEFEGFGDDEYMDDFGWQDMIDARGFVDIRKRQEEKDEFGIGQKRNAGTRKSFSKLAKKVKKRKTAKTKKTKGKHKRTDKKRRYETESDQEYTDMEDVLDGGEFNLYVNSHGNPDSPHVFDPITGRYISRQETDDDKLGKGHHRKDMADQETVSGILSGDHMIGELESDMENGRHRSLNLGKIPGHSNSKKTKKKRRKVGKDGLPGFKSFRNRKVDAWLEDSAFDGDPVPLFYEDPALKGLPPLQRVHRKKKATLWTDILRKFGVPDEPHDFKSKRNMSENRWRKLLEELYTDKKYFDYVNKTSKGKKVEKDLKNDAKSGLEYLTDRATFWEEQKPIPERPSSYISPYQTKEKEKEKEIHTHKKHKSHKRKKKPTTPMTQVRMDMIMSTPPAATTMGPL